MALFKYFARDTQFHRFWTKNEQWISFEVQEIDQ